MKNIYYFAIATALGLGLTACSSEEPLAAAKGDGVVTFTAQLPTELASRAFNDGKTATTLTYAVYETGVTPVNPIIVSEDEVTFGDDLTATVSLQLVNGKTYDILFWADAAVATGKTNPFTFTPATQTVAVNYAAMASNNDACDAFFAAEKALEVKGAINKTVTLTRPFAQVNFGTDDLDEATVKNAFEFGESGFGKLQTKLAFTKALPDQLNLLTGEVTTVATDATAFDAVAPTTEEFPYEPLTYDHLSMTYVLVGADKDIVDLTFDVIKEDETQPFNTLSISAVPVQRNYQTNIYGSLLTSTANFKVEIKPAFTDNINIGDWDGKTVVEPVINETEKTVTVRNPAEFMGLLSMTNGDDSNNFEGYTVTLTDDLDFKGNPAVLGATSSSKPFSGVLDGQGHTLKNVTLEGSSPKLIGYLKGENAEVKNLNFENLNINAPTAYTAGVIGNVSGGAKVTDVVVKSGKIETRGGSGVAAIISYVSGPATITGCVNEGADVVATSSGRAAGVIGYTTTPKVGESIIVSDCHNKANVTAASSSGQYVGGVVGMSSAEVSNCTNTGTITGGYGSLGGVVGEQRNCGSVKDCVNTGAVIESETTNPRSYGAGGVVGWVRYYYSSNYQPLLVENCKNTADIYAPHTTGVGGIVGMWYHGGTLTKCENTANSITGGTFVSGLSGGQQYVGVDPKFEDDNLYVKNNRSTTIKDNIKGSCSDIFIYKNSPDKVIMENNTNE